MTIVRKHGNATEPAQEDTCGACAWWHACERQGTRQEGDCSAIPPHMVVLPKQGIQRASAIEITISPVRPRTFTKDPACWYYVRSEDVSPVPDPQ